MSYHVQSSTEFPGIKINHKLTSSMTLSDPHHFRHLSEKRRYSNFSDNLNKRKGT